MRFYLDARYKTYSKEGLDKIGLGNLLDGLLVEKGNSLVLTDLERNHLSDVVTLVVNTASDMQSLLEADYSNITHAILETNDWTIIPFENLVAKLQPTGTQLLGFASNKQEVELLRNVLEVGIDGIVLDQFDDREIENLFDSKTSHELELMEAEIISIESMGNGDRVCVDTVSILDIGEGMLVGSTAALQALVEAEVEESGYVNPRPFRINAGVVASYTLNRDQTNYLSELQAGSSVMIVDREGKSRIEKVARVKIERRPLLLIKIKLGDETYPVILQDAETVKLITPSGSVRVTEIEIGNKILVHLSSAARHFGMPVDEFLQER